MRRLSVRGRGNETKTKLMTRLHEDQGPKDGMTWGRQGEGLFRSRPPFFFSQHRGL